MYSESEPGESGQQREIVEPSDDESGEDEGNFENPEQLENKVPPTRIPIRASGSKDKEPLVRAAGSVTYAHPQSKSQAKAPAQDIVPRSKKMPVRPFRLAPISEPAETPTEGPVPDDSEVREGTKDELPKLEVPTTEILETVKEETADEGAVEPKPENETSALVVCEIASEQEAAALALEGQSEVRLIVDTGATHSILSITDAERLNQKYRVVKLEAVAEGQGRRFRSASGEVMVTATMATFEIPQLGEATFHVMDHPVPPLLGMDILQHGSINLAEGHLRTSTGKFVTFVKAANGHLVLPLKL
jgi:hypothetical protein